MGSGSDRHDDESTARAAAMAAARGWSVVPVHSVEADRCSCGRASCPSAGKHPRVAWEEWTTTRATPDRIEQWWRRWPAANLGIVTGWVSALVVLDVDPRHGGDDELARLVDGTGGLPATLTCLTGGGGRHLYFAHPTRLVPSRPLAPGLDLKAEGGLVVAPPSRHASGATYRWAAGAGPDERAPAALPAWLEALALDPAVRSGRTRRDPVAEDVPERTRGERAEFTRLWGEVGVDPGDEEVMVRCPFHDDRHPSLHVDPVGCRWFCFGCRRGGGLGALRRLVHPEAAPVRPVPAAGPGEPALAAEVEVDVVGESRHQDTLLALTGGTRTWAGAHRRVLAELVPTPDDPYDAEAVEVRIDGRPVGHLSRAAARIHRPMIGAAIGRGRPATCLAEIRGGWERGHGDVGRFGVVLWLPASHDPGSLGADGPNRPPGT